MVGYDYFGVCLTELILMFDLIMPFYQIIISFLMIIITMIEGRFQFQPKHHYHQPATIDSLNSYDHGSANMTKGLMPVFLATIIFISLFAALIMFMWGCSQRNPYDTAAIMVGNTSTATVATNSSSTTTATNYAMLTPPSTTTTSKSTTLSNRCSFTTSISDS